MQAVNQLRQSRARFLKFRQRQQRAFGDLQYGALRLHLEAAHGFDLIAEHFEAHRLRRLRRVDVEDAAAHGIFAHHFDGIPFFVTDALQVREQIVERNLLARSQRERKLAIKFAWLDA